MSEIDYEFFKSTYNMPEVLWDRIAQSISWSKQYDTVISCRDSPCARWFCGGQLNISYNCLDKHVEDGYGDDTAWIFDSPVTETVQKFTYRQLLYSVEQIAGVLVQRCNLRKGDKVLFYMPPIPECLIGMLACARIGVTYTAVFSGFAVRELAKRISHTEPKCIITANIGFQLMTPVSYKDRVDVAIKESKHKVDFCLVYNRPNFPPAVVMEGRDLDWDAEKCKAKPESYVNVESDHPLFIIYTSGTTGNAKGMVMSTGGIAVCSLFDMIYHYDMKPGERSLSFSDYGWIVGQVIGVYGYLLRRVVGIRFEGHITKTPDSKQLSRLLISYQINHMSCVPTVMRMIKKECSEEDLKQSSKSLKYIFFGGEKMEPSLKKWAQSTFGCNVHEIYGSTEFGGVICGPCLGIKNNEIEVNENSTFNRLPSSDFRIVDRNTGQELPMNVSGRLVMKIPLRPSFAMTFYKNESGFLDTYFKRFPGFFDTMDSGVKIRENAFKLLSRDDDVIQVGAARISGAAIEEACLYNKDITEAVAVGLDDDILGEVPFVFLITVKDCTSSNEEIVSKTIEIVRQSIGDVAQFKNAIVVSALPRNANGKVSKHCLTAMLNGKHYETPSLIVNIEAFPEIVELLRLSGYKASLPSQ